MLKIKLMKKKRLSIVSIVLLSLLLTACGDSTYQEVNNSTSLESNQTIESNSTDEEKVQVVIDTSNLDIDINDTYNIVTENKTIPFSKTGSITIEADKNLTMPVILANEYGEPILIGRKFEGEDTVEISIESTAETFLLQSTAFFGVSITDDKELSKRIRSHKDFPKLLTELQESIENNDSCPTSHGCNMIASMVASRIAQSLDFSDLVEKDEE